MQAVSHASLALRQEFLFFSEGKEEKKLRVFFSEEKKTQCF